jgi:hypothetical protein
MGVIVMPRETDGKGNFKIFTFHLAWPDKEREWRERFVDIEAGEAWTRKILTDCGWVLEYLYNGRIKKEISFEWVHKGQFRIMKEGNVELLGIDYDEDDGFDGCADDPLNRKW